MQHRQGVSCFRRSTAILKAPLLTEIKAARGCTPFTPRGNFLVHRVDSEKKNRITDNEERILFPLALCDCYATCRRLQRF